MKKQAQVSIEYLVLFVGLILAILVFLGQSRYGNGVAKIYDVSGDSMSAMVGKTNTAAAAVVNVSRQ